MPTKLELPSDGSGPIYRQVAAAVRRAVAAGRLQPGEKLPPRAVLAEQLGVSAVTVGHGYALLENECVVRQRRGSGTYVLPDALERARRSIDTVWVVLGETSLTDCPRPLLFAATRLLDGMRDVLGQRRAHFVYAQSFTQEHLSDVGDQDLVLLKAQHAAIDPALVTAHAERRIPVLSVQAEHAALAIPSVTYDRFRAAVLGCRHLVDCGYRTIGYVGGTEDDNQWAHPKFQAFTHVLHAAGLDVRAHHVRIARYQPGRAYAATQKLIQDGDLPEALFVDTDYKAMEVIGALSDVGVKVPDDVAIVSYDDVPEAAGFDPPLTTVRTPRREMGQRIAQMALNWPETGGLPESEVLESQLIVRGTTGASAPAGGLKPPLAAQ